MEGYAELVAELRDWCRGEVVDKDYALMVLIPEQLEVEAIEATLQTVKCLGRVRVRGRMYSKQRDKYMVLCECREELGKVSVPPDVMPTDGGEAWPIITVGETSPAPEDDFTEKLAG